MCLRVAWGAKRYQVLLGIIARLAAKPFVMNFKIGHGSARLASPAISAQHLLTKFLIRLGIKP
jgi:hypothetical protein